MVDNTTTDLPGELMHEIAFRQTEACLAAVGREAMKGVAGWKGGLDPKSFIHEAIVNALMEYENGK